MCVCVSGRERERDFLSSNICSYCKDMFWRCLVFMQTKWVQHDFLFINIINKLKLYRCEKHFIYPISHMTIRMRTHCQTHVCLCAEIQPKN